MPANKVNPTRLASNRGSALLVPVVALPLTLLAFFILAIDRGPDFLAFGTMGICFVAFAGMFLLSNGPISGQWYTAPGFITILAAAEFVVIPFLRFMTGEDRVNSYYLKAMVYLLLGFFMLWIACWSLKKPCMVTFFSELPIGNPRVHAAAVLFFAIGVAANFVLWKLGAIGYLVTSTQQFSSEVSAVGALVAATQMLTMAMLVSGIEILGKGSKSSAMRLLFAISFILDIGFGLISGMKVEVLMPMFMLALLLGIVRKRLPRLAFALPLLFFAMQPFVSAYRVNLNAGYAAQINTVGGLTSALTKSVEDVLAGASSAAAHQSVFESAESRLSVLGLFHNVLQLPSPDLLNGDETVWMAPFYPFIPRPLWKGKPVFDKGHRMSEALGIGSASSTNVPAIADMYALGGLAGIVAGMFLWGAILQAFMNTMKGGLSERGLFFYVLILFQLTTIEHDVVGMIGSAVETTCILLVLSKFVYGGPLFSLNATARRATA